MRKDVLKLWSNQRKPTIQHGVQDLLRNWDRQGMRKKNRRRNDAILAAQAEEHQAQAVLAALEKIELDSNDA